MGKPTQNTMLRTVASRSVRGLSVASARNMATEAPVKLHGLDGRYATSLWKVASEKGELDKVEKDLGSFSGMTNQEAVAQLLHNPAIPKNSKIGAVSTNGEVRIRRHHQELLLHPSRERPPRRARELHWQV